MINVKKIKSRRKKMEEDFYELVLGKKIQKKI